MAFSFTYCGMKLLSALEWRSWQSKCFDLNFSHSLQTILGSALLFVLVSYVASTTKNSIDYGRFASPSQTFLTSINTSRTRHQGPKLREFLYQQRTLFGLGWFFEWPGGRHPLNTTWPWADVKPSLIVLWGVCWMFAIDPRARVNMSFNPYCQGPSSYNAAAKPQYSTQATQYGVNSEPARHYTGHNQFQSSQGFEMASPVIKAEVGESRYSPAPLPRDRAFNTVQVYAQQVIPQAMAQDQADTLPPRHTPGVTTARSPRGRYLDATNSTNVQECPPLINGSSHTTAQSDLSPTGVPQIYNYNQHNVVGQPRNPRHPPHPQSRYYYPSSFNLSNFTPTSSAYSSPSEMANEMAMYEPQSFQVDYPRTMMHTQADDMHQRYPSPPPPMSDNSYNNHQAMDEAAALIADLPELPQKEDSDAPSPGRSKPVPKPDREVTKGDDGRFVCTWPGCTEEVRTFNRKCEWSKHMDKHDRPYKCPAEGCEKLPGFTYSGGLLRHQREVHNLHGGPRKQLNCPHPNCKRYSGKGFSRQENLNEHMRRVHTDGGAEAPDGVETEEETSERAGMKRKRTSTETPSILQEIAKLRKENEKLKRQAAAQDQRTNELIQQVQNLQSIVGIHALPQAQQQAPQANMTGLQAI